MAQHPSTTPSKPGERTKKYKQRKHLPSYWEVIGDKWRGRKMKKEENKSKSSDTEEEDKPHHDQSGDFLGFHQHGNNHNPNDDIMFPPQQFHNAPNQAPPGAFSGLHSQGHAQPQPQLHNMPNMTNARALQSGEMNAHMQRGGQTEYGERPRGLDQSVYANAERTVPGRGRGGGASSRRQPQHPWMPETQHYEQERTRRR